MGALQLTDIARVTGGRLHGDNREIVSVSIDTRQLMVNDLYVALRGEHFDGHDFIVEAVERGAAAAVAERDISLDCPLVEVEDARLALGRIAAMNRRAFTGPVLALTGSCGKTTCKEMLAAILGRHCKVLATRGNLNNEIGVPLTLLGINPEHQCAVIEMGAAKPGDIAYLCQFVRPDIALVTNAAAAHLEGFGSIETVAKTKGEIYRNLPGHGIAVINLDDPHAALWQSYAEGRRQITVSSSGLAADVTVHDITVDAAGTHFILRTADGEASVSLRLPGEAMARNAALAAAAAGAAGATLADIVAGLEQLRPVKGRLQRLRSGDITLIDDSYNANPASMAAAIAVLAASSPRRLLVLGDMAELGPQSAQLHEQVGAQAAERGIERLLATGRFAADTARGFGTGAETFTGRDALIERLLYLLAPGDTVLVKGSRSAGMDAVVDALIRARPLRGTATC